MNNNAENSSRQNREKKKTTKNSSTKTNPEEYSAGDIQFMDIPEDLQRRVDKIFRKREFCGK